MTITVELDVYSGRPNPSWQLNATESEELLQQLSLLSEFEKSKEPLNDGLGYRGFLLSIQGADARDSLPKAIRVFKGTVYLDAFGYDDNIFLEKKLFQQAKEHGYKNILESLGE